MRYVLRSLVTALMALSVAGSAHAAVEAAPRPAIGMTFEEFRKALDDKIRDDTKDKSAKADITFGCVTKNDVHTCSFGDAGFQKMVEGFRGLGVISGRFTQKLKLVVDTAGGKVTHIALFGDRSDPMNSMQFMGTVFNVLQISEPSIGQAHGETSKVTDALGILRGDDAPDIGKPRVLVKPYASISCLTQESHVSKAVRCDFGPPG